MQRRFGTARLNAFEHRQLTRERITAVVKRSSATVLVEPETKLYMLTRDEPRRRRVRGIYTRPYPKRHFNVPNISTTTQKAQFDAAT